MFRYVTDLSLSCTQSNWWARAFSVHVSGWIRATSITKKWTNVEMRTWLPRIMFYSTASSSCTFFHRAFVRFCFFSSFRSKHFRLAPWITLFKSILCVFHLNHNDSYFCKRIDGAKGNCASYVGALVCVNNDMKDSKISRQEALPMAQQQRVWAAHTFCTFSMRMGWKLVLNAFLIEDSVHVSLLFPHIILFSLSSFNSFCCYFPPPSLLYFVRRFFSSFTYPFFVLLHTFFEFFIRCLLVDFVWWLVVCQSAYTQIHWLCLMYWSKF